MTSDGDFAYCRLFQHEPVSKRRHQSTRGGSEAVSNLSDPAEMGYILAFGRDRHNCLTVAGVGVGCQGVTGRVPPPRKPVVHPALQALLTPFEATVLNDPSVLGVLYTGSLGRGIADRFSDLDIVAWVAGEAAADPDATLQRLLARLGPIRLVIPGDPRSVTGLVSQDWRRVDLDLRRRDELEPDPHYAGARIVKDFDGALARLVAASTPDDVGPTWEAARQEILVAIDSQIYLAAHNARGATWSAMEEVTYRLALLYELVARLRGRRSYGFRYVEGLLSPAEQRLLEAAWPSAPDREEVRRAARELWAWTRLVWEEAERSLGRPLEVTVDEAELLAAVDVLYDG
jgi:hypothetical protein